MTTEKFTQWCTPGGLLRLEGWARDGLSDAQLAKKLGCSTAALARWKKRSPEIRRALERGRDVVDREVENALLQRALGYTYSEEQITEDGDKRKVVQTRKTALPDTKAQIFWLQARKPGVWRDPPAPQEQTPPADGFVEAMRAGAQEAWQHGGDEPE